MQRSQMNIQDKLQHIRVHSAKGLSQSRGRGSKDTMLLKEGSFLIFCSPNLAKISERMLECIYLLSYFEDKPKSTLACKGVRISFSKAILSKCMRERSVLAFILSLTEMQIYAVRQLCIDSIAQQCEPCEHSLT